MSFNSADPRHAQARAQIAARQDVARRNGYLFEYHPQTRIRGWPAPSMKPFALVTVDGKHVASFASFDAMERGFAARAGL